MTALVIGVVLSLVLVAIGDLLVPTLPFSRLARGVVDFVAGMAAIVIIDTVTDTSHWEFAAWTEFWVGIVLGVVLGMSAVRRTLPWRRRASRR